MLIFFILASIIPLGIYLISLNQLKKSKSELQKYKDDFRYLRIGRWEGTLNSDINIWSDEMYLVYGLDPKKHTPFRENFYELVHPEEREEYKAKFNKALEDGADFHLSYKAMHTDGTYHLYQTHGKVIWEEGKSIGFHGTVQDITIFN